MRKIAFGKTGRGPGGDLEVPVLVDGTVEITLRKAEDGSEWYTYGTRPVDDKPSPFFQGIGSDGVDLGTTLREAKKWIRHPMHFKGD